ncbi:hypothetical protein ACOSQ4_029516 [Xanthoceras sorbifolium]
MPIQTPYDTPGQTPHETPGQTPNSTPIQASYLVPDQAPYSTPISVVGPQFCTPYPLDLAIVNKLLSGRSFSVTDINGNDMFKVKGKFFTLHDRRVLLDGDGNPIVTLIKKIRTIHDRWHVFRGKSTSSKDLLFTVKRSSMLSSMFQTNANLEMFLANNKKEEVCDFQVKGSWSGRSCVIYLGESTTIVAQLRYTNHLINYTHNLSTWYN